MSVSYPRDLSTSEKEVVRHLLSTFEDTHRFQSQLDSLKVIGICACGCPSIDFQEHDPQNRSHPIANFAGQTEDGMDVGGMLWATDNKLTGLEVYCFGNNEKPFGLPTLSSIVPFPPNQSRK